MKHMLRRFLLLTIVLFVSATVWAEERADSDSKGRALFTASAYIEHVRYLASDELAGRRLGSEGSHLAAQYLSEHFEAAGCEPGGQDGSWYQPFDVRRGKRLVDEKAALQISGLDQEWKVRRDWIPFPFSEMGEVEGPLAFAGYGIAADKFDYDDYADFDAEGKILLILRHEPKDEDPEAEFGGDTPSREALFARKARTAAKQGAEGLLVVNAPNRDPDRDKLYTFSTFGARQTYQLPMVHITRDLANAILKQAGAPDLKTLQEQLDKERKSLSRDLGLTVELHTGLGVDTLVGKNVLGMIQGDGSTEDTIVVGAHRDHLGMTPTIRNGADDNASGTAALIELARVIGSGPPLHRNVLFIAFDGEEMGLLGSRHFVEQPTVDLDSIRAMINFDMIGRLGQNRYTIYCVPSAKEFPDLVKKHAEPLGLKYKAPRGQAYGSDHDPFLKKKVPAMFAFTGVHRQFHRPEDDWELIDAEGAARVLQMWHPIIVELANMEEGPTYTDPSAGRKKKAPTTKPAGEREPQIAKEQEANKEETGESDQPPSRTQLRVRLGIIPDMADDGKPGMIVQDVVEGGAAKSAGLKEGDRIMKIGDQPIRDIYAYMQALQDFEPGDVVDVVVTRQGKEITLKVKLEPSARPRSEGG